MFNARSIIDGVSLSNKNSIGEKLSTEALYIYDDGLHEKNISSTPFDVDLLSSALIESLLNAYPPFFS